MIARPDQHSSHAERHHTLEAARAAWHVLATSESPGWRWARRLAFVAAVVAAALVGLGTAQGATLSGTVGNPAIYTAGDPIPNNLTVTHGAGVYT
ncbi:MAG: hypothetical protein ACR2OD_02315, partial [Gaiellaceae bacterium]